MDPETRESLIARLPDHADTAAWEEFVQLYEPLIYGIGRRHGLQPGDAADLVQNVLIAVANSIQRFQPDGGRGRFRSWLFRVAQNQAMMQLRNLGRRVRAGGGTESMAVLNAQASPPDSDREFQMALRRRAFRWAARRVRHTVNESTWEAFARTAIECQSPSDVARQMGIDVGVVYLARSRVMSRLKKIVEGVSGDWSEHDFECDET